MTRPSRTDRLGDERVARRTQFGLPDVRRLDLLEAGHRPHDRAASLVHLEAARAPRARHRPACGRMTKLPLKLARVPSVSLEIWWHTVHETAVARETILVGVLRCDRQVREHVAELPCACRGLLGDGHVTGCALVLNGARFDSDDRASRAGHSRASTDRARNSPSSWIATTSPIDTSSPVGVTRLLWHATQLSECAKSGTFGVRLRLARGRAPVLMTGP